MIGLIYTGLKGIAKAYKAVWGWTSCTDQQIISALGIAWTCYNEIQGTALMLLAWLFEFQV